MGEEEGNVMVALDAHCGASQRSGASAARRPWSLRRRDGVAEDDGPQCGWPWCPRCAEEDSEGGEEWRRRWVNPERVPSLAA